ncbi:HDOD domain-containing protein [Sulfurimonas paralvinellae]|uniref:HDOD domain-containing protein n=1 Tax=Sulfurimonas paralvinellae TaxID=317658 RepID=A0A7M1B7U3_9BACT|nr:HDOD domain-containing protein [Sulfurimonas paralvinellae]QOP45774.1 HDOD domain-containing protein [Sulfurimonas paralvinellae]
MTYEDLVKNIDDMPPLSKVAMVIQGLYANGARNVDVRKLIRMIEADVMLTANILKTINSPYYGFRSQISSISQAVTLLGTQQIYSLVIHYAISQHLTADTTIYGFNNAQFNEMCILQSSLMMQWYAKIDLHDTHILTSLALIMESGKIIISKELMGSDYREEYRKGFLACENIPKFEQEFLSTTSYYLSALLFEHWNLTPIYSIVLKNLDRNESEYDEEVDAIFSQYIKAIDVIRTAINLKEVLTDASIQKAAAKVAQMGLSSEDFETVANRIRKKYEESA